MHRPSTPLLDELYAIATDELEPIGLFVVEPDWKSDYVQTPTNVRVFAVAGSEGVHFGLLANDGRVSDDSPVVMTVPGMLVPEESNIVVGENVREFLSFGARRGFDNLAPLATLEEAPKWFSEPPRPDDEASALLRKTFALGDALTFERFAELQREFGPRLELGAEGGT